VIRRHNRREGVEKVEKTFRTKKEMEVVKDDDEEEEKEEAGHVVRDAVRCGAVISCPGPVEEVEWWACRRLAHRPS
jgi:hypothetical protein